MAALAASLWALPHLKELGVSSNEIRDAGVCALAGAIRGGASLPKLEKLYLSQIGMSALGMRDLASALATENAL